MNEFDSKLANMQENWKDQKDAPPEDNRLPPGQYKVQLQSAEITESMASGRLQIHREHVITEGEHMGRVAHDYMQIETEWGPRFVVQWIQQMGFEPPDDIKDLPDVVAQIADAAPACIAKIKHSGDFQNIYIQRLVEYGSGADATPTQSAPEDVPAQAAPSTEAVDDAPLDDLFDVLVAFAQEHDIAITDNATAETIKALLAEYDWAEVESMEPEEVNLLTAAGLLEPSTEASSTEAVDDAAAPPSPGMRVLVTYGTEAYPGVVEDVNSKAETCIVNFDNGDHDAVAFNELEVASDVPSDASPDDEDALAELVAFCQAQQIDVNEDDTIDTLSKRVAEYEWHKDKLLPAEVEMLANLDVKVTLIGFTKKRAGKKA